MEILQVVMLWVKEHSWVLSAVCLVLNISIYQYIRYKVKKVIIEKEQRKEFFKKEDVARCVSQLFLSAFTLIAISNIKTGGTLDNINLILRWLIVAMGIPLAYVCAQSLILTLKMMPYRYRQGEYKPTPVTGKWYKRLFRF